MSETIIVVPCYNEAGRLPVESFRGFVRRTPGIRFLFVDDGSTDATAEALRSLRDSDIDSFDVHTLTENSGKGEAVRQGFLKAFESDPDYVGFWDADLATPLEAIREFRAVLDDRPDIEMAFGARGAPSGKGNQAQPVEALPEQAVRDRRLPVSSRRHL